VPSLQLIGDRFRQFHDLNALQDMGVEIVGRLAGCRDGTLMFSGALSNAAALSDLKMNRALAQMDAWAEQNGLDVAAKPRPFAPTRVAERPRLALDLAGNAISTIVWATGFQPDFSWLHLPVFDGRGRLRHESGIVGAGLYVLGLPFLRTRKSTLLDGVGDDARALARLVSDANGRKAA
jgi:putative flavoprotein involved in K+ transport